MNLSDSFYYFTRTYEIIDLAHVWRTQSASMGRIVEVMVR